MLDGMSRYTHPFPVYGREFLLRQNCLSRYFCKMFPKSPAVRSLIYYLENTLLQSRQPLPILIFFSFPSNFSCSHPGFRPFFRTTLSFCPSHPGFRPFFRTTLPFCPSHPGFGPFFRTTLFECYHCHPTSAKLDVFIACACHSRHSPEEFLYLITKHTGSFSMYDSYTADS